jgi:ribonuclease Y
MIYQNSILGLILFLIGGLGGYFIRQFLIARKANSLENQLKKELEETKIKAKELILKAQEKSAALLEEVKREEREVKGQLSRLEERLLKKEELLEKQALELRVREDRVMAELDRVKALKVEAEELKQKTIQQLEKIAGISQAEAKDLIFKNIESMYRQDLALMVHKLENERREIIEQKSIEIIASVIERYARNCVPEMTTSVFTLESEDLKGKIIGREGRNIRALERATGVEFIIDETPDSIVISSFDPIRREIAKNALQKLIADGRIQPAKIEEKVEEAKVELSKKIIELGEKAAFEVGIFDLPKEIIQLLGRLHFRHSYGQSVLANSVEAAHIAGMLASELGLNVDVAKKGALLHDIGKAIDHDVQGTHVELGRKILKKYGVDEAVIRAMEAHHEEYPFAIPEAYIVAAADTISASRPGARRDTVENYIKRLADLEKIALEFSGVKNAYAISAGRELRVFVAPEQIDDFGALQLARNIALRIESELKYPGEIKVNVIRELRAVEFAR